MRPKAKRSSSMLTGWSLGIIDVSAGQGSQLTADM